MIRNSNESWGWPTRALHWIVAALVLGLFAQGLWMEDLPRAQRVLQTWLHAAFGISLLFVSALAFVWWLVNPAPAEPPAMPAWQRHAARLAHWALYGLIFAVTVTGWALTGTMREPVAIELIGLIPVPQLLGPGSGYHGMLEETHEVLANALIALAAVHVAAALYHHFVRRDGVLLRMLGAKPKHDAH
jgi:cytochrome b561